MLCSGHLVKVSPNIILDSQSSEISHKFLTTQEKLPSYLIYIPLKSNL